MRSGGLKATLSLELEGHFWRCFCFIHSIWYLHQHHHPVFFPYLCQFYSPPPPGIPAQHCRPTVPSELNRPTSSRMARSSGRPPGLGGGERVKGYKNNLGKQTPGGLPSRPLNRNIPQCALLYPPKSNSSYDFGVPFHPYDSGPHPCRQPSKPSKLPTGETIETFTPFSWPGEAWRWPWEGGAIMGEVGAGEDRYSTTPHHLNFFTISIWLEKGVVFHQYIDNLPFSLMGIPYSTVIPVFLLHLLCWWM